MSIQSPAICARATSARAALLCAVDANDPHTVVVALRLAENSPLREFFGEDLIDNASDLIERQDAVEALTLLLPALNPEDLQSSLHACAFYGSAKCVGFLLGHLDDQADCSAALLAACEQGHVKCVKLLMGVGDPKANDSRALHVATGHGHADIVELLIPVSDPRAMDSRALGWAANGQPECLKLLIPFSDPKARHSLALRWASHHGQLECVQLLLPLSDPSDCGAEGLDGEFDETLTALELAKARGHQTVAGTIEAFVLARSEALELARELPEAGSSAVRAPGLGFGRAL